MMSPHTTPACGPFPPDAGQASTRPSGAVHMGEHVHVRLNHGLEVSEEGDLIELSRCRCGATWTRTYRADDAETER